MKKKKGFTLIELIVVISVLSITSAMMISPNIKALSSMEIKNNENLIRTKLNYMKNYCKNNYTGGKIIITPTEIKGLTIDNNEVFYITVPDNSTIESDTNEIDVSVNGDFILSDTKTITIKHKSSERTLEVNSLSIKVRGE